MNDIEVIEISAAEAKAKVDRHAKLEKLFSNREFKSLIVEGYLKDEIVRLGLISANPNMNDALRENTAEKIRAISHFDQFLRQIVTEGLLAQQELGDFEAELEELRANGETD